MLDCITPHQHCPSPVFIYSTSLNIYRSWASLRYSSNSGSQGMISWLRGGYFPFQILPDPRVRCLHPKLHSLLSKLEKWPTSFATSWMNSKPFLNSHANKNHRVKLAVCQGIFRRSWVWSRGFMKKFLLLLRTVYHINNLLNSGQNTSAFYAPYRPTTEKSTFSKLSKIRN